MLATVAAVALIGLADGSGAAIRSDASRPVDAIDASDRRFGVIGWGRLVNDRGTIGPSTSRSVNPINASCGVALLGYSHCPSGKHQREYGVFESVFHFELSLLVSGLAAL